MSIEKIFHSEDAIKKIQQKLPKLFQIAEIDNSRNGKLGMEIGSTREKIIIAFLIHYFGEENINTDIDITSHEIDVEVYNTPVSIKTFTGKTVNNIKLIWTVDQQKATDFVTTYQAECDMLLVQINWEAEGAVYLIPKDVQNSILNQIGNELYFIMPKEGTNARGLEISKHALTLCIQHINTERIPIQFARDESINFSIYDRWLDLWEND